MSDDVEHLIADGVRAERAGAMDRALDAYRAAAGSASVPAARAQAHSRLADALRGVCRWDEALEAARTAQAIAADAGLDDVRLEAMVAETNVLMARGLPDAARPLLELVVAQATDPRLRGIALQNIGTIHAQCGHGGAAERAFRESLGNFHRAGYRRGECIALNNMGRLALETGDPQRARPTLEQALAIAREIEDMELAALASLNLASALCESRELDRAQDLVMASLGYFSGSRNRWREIECFRLMGDINDRCEDLDNAVRCYRMALHIAAQIGSDPEVRASRDRLAAALRKRPDAGATTQLPVWTSGAGDSGAAMGLTPGAS